MWNDWQRSAVVHWRTAFLGRRPCFPGRATVCLCFRRGLKQRLSATAVASWSSCACALLTLGVRHAAYRDSVAAILWFAALIQDNYHTCGWERSVQLELFLLFMHAGFNSKRWLALSPRTEKVAGSFPRGLEAFLCGVLCFLPVSCEELNSKNALQLQHKTITDSN